MTEDQQQAPTAPASQKVSDVIGGYRPVKVCRALPLVNLFLTRQQAFKTSKPESSYVTSLDFDDQGDYLVSAGDDEVIQVYDIKEGKATKSVPSKKYGVHLARFTHHSRQVLHASTKVDGKFGFQSS